MLRFRECDRPRPSRSLGEGAKGVGSYRVKGWASRQQLTLPPLPQLSRLFPSNGEILQGCWGVALKVEQGTKWVGLLGLLFFKGQTLAFHL